MRGAHLPGGPLQRRHSSTWLLSKFIEVGLNRSLTQWYEAALEEEADADDDDSDDEED